MNGFSPIRPRPPPRPGQPRTNRPAPPTPTSVDLALDAPMPEVEPLTTEQIFAALHRLSLGSAAVGEPWPAPHAEVISATVGVLHEAATEDRYTPRRPSLLPQLLRAMNDEEVSRRELVTIISRDPSLVGNLLKMANSPFYRVSAQAVESIDRAVVILAMTASAHSSQPRSRSLSSTFAAAISRSSPRSRGSTPSGPRARR